MVWLSASKNGLTSSIIFKLSVILSYKNYIEIVLSDAQSGGKRLTGKDFIYQQDNATPYIHTKLLTWYEENFVHFINNNRCSLNSPDLNILDYYMWDANANNM